MYCVGKNIFIVLLLVGFAWSAAHSMLPDATCPVCYEMLDKTLPESNPRASVTTRRLGCQHPQKFHKKCLDEWVQARGSCPLCRRPAIPALDHILALSQTESFYDEKTRTLDLSDLGIKEFDGEIFERIASRFPHLRVLTLANNNLALIPWQVSKLRRLRILDLSNNELLVVPANLRDLKHLKKIDFSGNPFAHGFMWFGLHKSELEIELPGVQIEP